MITFFQDLMSCFNLVTTTGFKHLRILGLSSTRISNKLLSNRTLNHCKNLAQLNLSRTRISNKHLNQLVLPSLTQLNLDWTRVTSDCATLLTGTDFNCPLSRKVEVECLRNVQGPVSRKSRKPFGPEKPFVKLRPLIMLSWSFHMF